MESTFAQESDLSRFPRFQRVTVESPSFHIRWSTLVICLSDEVQRAGHLFPARPFWSFSRYFSVTATLRHVALSFRYVGRASSEVVTRIIIQWPRAIPQAIQSERRSPDISISSAPGKTEEGIINFHSLRSDKNIPPSRRQSSGLRGDLL